MLLVNHNQAERIEPYRVFKHGMSPYQYVQRAIGQRAVDVNPFLFRGRAGEQSYIQPYFRGHLRYGLIMLGCQYLGRGHKACLGGIVDGYEHGHQRNQRLARADVPL